MESVLLREIDEDEGEIRKFGRAAPVRENVVTIAFPDDDSGAVVMRAAVIQ